MFIFDGLYGRLNFPPLVSKLLDCPGLLRLRDVRMANIPFLSFPAFANTSRYEHSLGVCYLAQLVGNSIKLSEKDRTELMIASLYHDVATPPFANAVEEAMDKLYSFDHERKLKELITGEGKTFSGQKHQVFLGRTLKLHRICQSREGQKIGLDLYRIADLAVGVKNDFLGDLICSDGIDLDNIDNVVRAARAMGIRMINNDLSKQITLSFCLYNGKLYLQESSKILIAEWQTIRSRLYNLIFSSIADFSQQTMLKEAVRILAENSGFLEDDWSLTDTQLLYDRLRGNEATRRILHKLLLGNPYNCLAVFVIEGDTAVLNTKNALEKIEIIAKEMLLGYLTESISSNMKTWREISVVANYFVDKRFRPINREYFFMGQKSKNVEKSKSTRVILGLFSAYHRKLPKKLIDNIQEKLSLYCFKDCSIHQAKIDTHAEYPEIH